jgi:very-short-patch-repair endonuclease
MWYPRTEKNRQVREIKFKKQLFYANPKLELVGDYINSTTNVEFKCLTCGTEHQLGNPRSLIYLDAGCAKCDGKRKLLVGYNDFATTHPHFICMFKNKDDTKITTSGAGTKFDMVCPICGYEKKISPNHLVRRGFSCSKCGDGYSYPNRFMLNLLYQLKVKFDSEKQFNWSNRRRYDFIYEKYIIEMDGGYHKGSKTLTGEEAKRIDNLKDKLAIENGYEVIRIECFTSEFNYIKNNVLNSKLANIFNFDEFDWIKLEKELITSNLVKIASELFNKYKGIKNLSEISDMMNIRTYKLCSLLKTSSRIGLTDYDAKLSTCGQYTANKNMTNLRKCICLETGKIYNSCKEAEDEFGFKKDAIARVCRGERLTVCGKQFDFINTTEEIQNKKKKMEHSKSKPSHSAKKIMCIESGEIYNSATEASKFFGMHDGYISNLIIKNRKTKEGYTFKYI